MLSSKKCSHSSLGFLLSFKFPFIPASYFSRNLFPLCPFATHSALLQQTTHLLTPWCYSSCRTVATSHIPSKFLYVRFRDNKFLQGGVVSPTPNQPGGPGYLSWSGISFKTCPAWVLLQAATVPLAQLLSSSVHTSPLTQQQNAFNKVVIPSRGTINYIVLNSERFWPHSDTDLKI
jgi:hypothetical protein